VRSPDGPTTRTVYQLAGIPDGSGAGAGPARRPAPCAGRSRPHRARAPASV